MEPQLYSEMCDFITRTQQVKCNVFVGKQQYDAYIDDDVIKKRVCIFNIFKDNCVSECCNDSKTVVFLGSITDSKGFLEICRMWKGIVKQVPDTQLLVMGSGALYGETKLGSYGIADSNFENKFIPFITDEDGSILDAIKFLSIVGSDKGNIFLNLVLVS